MSIIGNPLVIGTMGGGKNSIDILKVASESDLPATYTNNAIAVATTEEITSYYFSATQPDTGTEGLLWIISDSRGSNKITLINNQAVELYPAGAKLYHDNAWINIPSWVFKVLDNIWHSCRLVFMENGILNQNVVGSIMVGGASTDYSDGYPSIYNGGTYWRCTFGGASVFERKFGFLGDNIIYSNYSNIVVSLTLTHRMTCNIGYVTTKMSSGRNYTQFFSIGTINIPVNIKNQVTIPITSNLNNQYLTFNDSSGSGYGIYVYDCYLI